MPAELMGPYTALRSEFGVPVKMRDGVTLYADVYRPDVADPLPVLLQRTPYDKFQGVGGGLDVLRAASHGYAVVIQDTRGRYASEGEFYPFLDEPNDGYDTVAWCADQPWSTGKVGMFGRSYVGATQWLCAITNPPALTCISPGITASDYYEGWTYQGGALAWGFALSWTMRQLTMANMGDDQQPPRRAGRNPGGPAGGVQRAGLRVPAPAHRGNAAPEGAAGRLLLRLDPALEQR